MSRELIRLPDGQMTWRAYDEPALEPSQVRVRSDFGAAKHGTEIAGHKGYAAQRGPFDKEQGVFTYRKSGRAGPSTVGNMTVGTVVEAGAAVGELAGGDRVLLYGGFRETHVCTHDRCSKLPPQMSWQSAVCLDPADFALGAIRDGHVRVGDAVAIFGMGAIGLMAVQLARLAGALPVIAVEPLTHRRELAARLGANVVFDPAACDAGLEIRKATGNVGADVVIEYSGSVQALQAALRGVAYGGTVVAGAFPGPYGAGLDLGAEAHINVPNIVFSRSCSEPNRDAPRWSERRIQDVCLRLLGEGQVGGDQIVTPVVKFEELPEAYPKIMTEPDVYIKLGCIYETGA
ncbi:MAG TPA: zinc-binding alcohol dehydrogenase [Phycisphaerae bacterium]|nr:zinc-binding alcohol dehydrogenase [Phycisphaerae bacterium]